ncbi:hypothetical protein Tco_0997921 [Tanacetum coccineum]
MAAAMKHTMTYFSKLDKFERMDFRRLQKKMHFLLSTMSVVYILSTTIPIDGDDATMKQIRKRSKWKNDDYVCRGLILNEAKYMAEDALSEKFLISDFSNYKMNDLRPVLEQYNELLGILELMLLLKIEENRLAKEFKICSLGSTEELTLVELGSHMRIKESLMVQDQGCKRSESSRVLA